MTQQNQSDANKTSVWVPRGCPKSDFGVLTLWSENLDDKVPTLEDVAMGRLWIREILRERLFCWWTMLRLGVLKCAAFLAASQSGKSLPKQAMDSPPETVSQGSKA
jgi:hypothetical protein